MLPCGHPAVNEFLLHHSLQCSPFFPPSPHSSTLHRGCAGRCWPLLCLTSPVFVFWLLNGACLWNILHKQYFRLYFCTIFKEFHLLFCHKSLHEEVSLFLHINIHDFFWVCTKAKVKDASHSVGKYKCQLKAVISSRCASAVEKTGQAQQVAVSKITASFPAYFFIHKHGSAPLIKENCLIVATILCIGHWSWVQTYCKCKTFYDHYYIR